MRVVAISISLLAALAQFVSAARMQQSSHDPDDILIPEEKASTNIANERASIGYAALGGCVHIILLDKLKLIGIP